MLDQRAETKIAAGFTDGTLKCSSLFSKRGGLLLITVLLFVDIFIPTCQAGSRTLKQTLTTIVRVPT